jgi:hypothetical protein
MLENKIFPFGFEVMGSWEDPTALPVPRSKTWVRFFAADRQGRQTGRDAFSRIFDSIDFLAFMCSREFRMAAALEAHGCHWNRSGAYRFWVHEDLTPADREQIARIVGAHAAAPPKSVISTGLRASHVLFQEGNH